MNALGVPAARIRIEDLSLTTHDQAVLLSLPYIVRFPLNPNASVITG